MAILGELETRIMENLWQRSAPASVRDVHDDLRAERELAYTTVMTVLDRLAKKHLVQRERDGRAWLYVSGPSRAELYGSTALELLQDSRGDQAAVLRRIVAGLDAAQRRVLRDALAEVGD